jgi:peptide/nickel transport system substrate-binding protein
MSELQIGQEKITINNVGGTINMKDVYQGLIRGKKRSKIAMAGIALATLVVANCGGSTSSSTDTEVAAVETPARELIVARDMDINSLDPARTYCDTCQIYMAAAYETLIGLDVNDPSIQIPRIATSWEGNADNTVFTFQLNPDAKFADGSAITSADVKWSWERLMNIKGSASYFLDGVALVEAPDAATVVVTFSAANSAFLAIVSSTYMSIVNSKVATEEGSAIAAAGADTTDLAEQWFFTHSAGSGPYTLESYTEGDSLVLVRNESYWGTPAVFPKVTIKQVKDASAQLQLLQNGDADIAMQLSFDSTSQLDGNASVVATPQDSYNYVYIALSPGAKGAENLKDPKVREAIKLAIDYDGMIDITVAGNGKKQASPIPNGFTGSADLALPAQDIEKAKALMAEAGMEAGFSIDAIFPNANVYGVDFNVMMQKAQQDLKAINIELVLQPVEWAKWSETIKATGIPVTAVYFAPDHTDSSQYVQYFGMIDGSSWATRAGGGAAGKPIANAKEQELLAKALAAGADTKSGLYSQLGQELINDLVIFPMVNPQLLLAYASDIEGMHYSACCNLELGKLTLKK